MNLNRRQLFRNFDGMTCIAAALGTVFLAVIIEAGLRDDYQRQEGRDDEPDANAVDRFVPGNSGHVPSGRAKADARRGPATQASAGGGGLVMLAAVSPDAGGTGHAGGSVRLFRAIRQVESGGNDHPPVGDGGKSVGPYQCGRAAWIDGGGKAADYPRLAYDRAATERVMLGYWAKYGAVTDEARSKCWNVGPRWRTRAKVDGERYWNHVREAMR